MSPEHWVVSAGLVATSAMALIANALLLLVFCRRRGLRTISNRFVINLLATNLLSSIVLIPLLLVDQELQNDQIESNSLILMKEENNSARFEIENILLEETVTISEIMDEEEIPFKIRHLEHHLIKWRNESLLLNNSMINEDNSNTILCYLSGGSTSLVCTASILSILLIAIDQYFAVTHPLRYHAFIDKFKSLILLITTWLVSLIFGISGAFVQTETSVWNFCEIKHLKNQQTNIQNIYNIFYAFTYLILVILLPFLVICVIYFCIYCAAHKNSERMRKSNSGSSTTNLDAYIQIPLTDNTLKIKVNSSDNVSNVGNKEIPKLPKVKSAPNFVNYDRTRLQMPVTKLCEDNKIVTHVNSLRTNGSFINSLKTKISNASLFKYREETRAAKISILVIFMVLVCYVPYGLTLIINTTNITNKKTLNFVIITKYLNCISLSLLVCANFSSPFLFAYRNRRIKRELKKLFGLLPKKTNRDMSILRGNYRSRNVLRNNSCIYRPKEMREFMGNEPFLERCVIPEVIVTCKNETEKKSILKRVCSKGKTWKTAKKCNFISVPECLSSECRCSFSSASTQVSSEEYSVCN